MKSLLAFALIVGVALGNSTSYYGWKPERQFRYRYTSEVLTGIPDIKLDQYSGIRITSDVVVQAFRDYTLRIKFENPKYVVFNDEGLPVGPDGNVHAPEATQELEQWFKTQLTTPFEAHVRRGVIEKSFFANGEKAEVTNIKKGLLSQLTMDLTGSGRGFLVENAFVSGSDPLNMPPLTPEQQTYFSTLESTVEGMCQTDYTFVPIPESEARLRLMGQISREDVLVQQGVSVLPEGGKSVEGAEQQYCSGKQHYEVVKTRNYNNCVRRPVFQVSYGIHSSCDASKGYCQDLLSHVSTTRYVICGQREEFIIREIKSEGEVQTNPMGWNTTPEKVKQSSRVYLTLTEMKEGSGFTPMPRPQGPFERDTLTFEYPIGSHDAIPEKKLSYEEIINPGNTSYIHPIRRVPDLTSESNILFRIDFGQMKTQFVQKIQEAVEFFQMSLSCSGKKDVAGILSDLSYRVRPISLQQIKELETAVKNIRFEHENQTQLAASLYYDILAVAGSNPALKHIKDVVKGETSPLSHLLTDKDKARFVMTGLRSTFTPTEEIMDEFLDLIKHFADQSSNDDGKKQIYSSGLVGLTNLVYRACMDPITAVTAYPVRIYGRFCNGTTSFVPHKLIPFLEQQLDKTASNEMDKETIRMIVISALGKTGHKEALRPLTKVIQNTNGDENTMTRSLAVNSLRRVARTEPTMTRRILLALIDNLAETTEVRISAVAVLPYTQPSVGDLQKMAVRSWYEPSKQVGSFVYSTLKSLVGTRNPELRPVGDKARTLLHLVKPFQTGLTFSQNLQSNNYIRYLLTAFSGEFNYILGDHSAVPTRMSVGSGLFGSAWKIDGLTFTTYVNGMDKLWEKIISSFGAYPKVSREAKILLDDVDRQLGISKGGLLDSKPMGLLQIKSADLETMLPYSTRHYEQIIEKVQKALSQPIGGIVESGEHVFHTSYYNNYVNIEGFGANMAGYMIYMNRQAPVTAVAAGKTQIKSQVGKTAEYSLITKPEINGKIMGTFGIVVPQQLTKFVGSSVEMSVHVALPVEGKIFIDGEHGKIDLKVNFVQDESTGGDIEIFHYFTKPTTFIHDFSHVGSWSEGTHKVILREEDKKQWSRPIFKYLGVDARYEVDTDYRQFDFPAFMNMVRQHNFGSFFTLGPMAPSVRQNSIKLKLNVASSSTKQFETTFTYMFGNMTGSQPELKTPLSSSLQQQSSLPWESKSEQELKQELKSRCQEHHQLTHEVDMCVEKEIKKVDLQKKTSEALREQLNQLKPGSVGHGIAVESAIVGSQISDRKAVKVHVVGASQSGEGESVLTFKTEFSGCGGSSGNCGFTYVIEGESKSEMAQKILYRWDVDQLIHSPVRMNHNLNIKYGKKSSSKSEFNMINVFEKDQTLIDSIKNSQEYRRCQDEIQLGHHLSSVCEELRHQAASINKVSTSMTLPEQLKKCPIVLYGEELLKSYFLTNLIYEGNSNGGNDVHIEAWVNRHGDMADVNVTGITYQYRIKDIRVPETVGNFLPFSLRNPFWVRLVQKMTRDQSPASCRLNAEWASTFDNRTYDYTLKAEGCKVVLFKDCEQSSVTRKPVQVVGTKGQGSQFKEVQIVGGQTVVIMDGQGSDIKIKYSIDGTTFANINVQAGKWFRKYDSEGKLVLEVFRYQDGVYFVYDPINYTGVFYGGQSKSVEIVSPQVWNKNRGCGLCGDNNGEFTYDVRSPKQCVMSQPRFGAYTYLVNSTADQCLTPYDKEQTNKESQTHCVSKKSVHTPVHKLAQTLLTRSYQYASILSASPLSHVVDETPNYICLSFKPIRTCPVGQYPTEVFSDDVHMSCLPKYWPMAQQLAKRASQGEVLSELSMFPARLTQRVLIPTLCSGGYQPYAGVKGTGNGGIPVSGGNYRIQGRGY